MTIIESIILGLVQGLTEFLPVSSSGHLAVFQEIFKKDYNVISYNVALHVATLIAVFIIFKDDVLEMIRKPFSRLTLMVVAGTIPTLIIGAAFSDFFDKMFRTNATLGLQFFLTGIILWYVESVKTKGKNLEQMRYTDAIFVGVAQGIAILPAVSRSGMTISGALWRGLDRKFALRYSFLMSIPAILAAAAKDAYDLVKAGPSASMGVEPLVLIVGMLAAGISGYIAVKFMLDVFRKASLKVFSYYVFALGALIIIDQFVFNIIFSRPF